MRMILRIIFSGGDWADDVDFNTDFVWRLVGIALMAMRLFGNFVAVSRHHLGGDAVIRQLRCGYLMRFYAAEVTNLKG